MKWFKRLLLLSLVLLVLGLVAGGTGFYMYRSKPSWYHPRKLTQQQKSDANNLVIQTFADLSTWVQSIQLQRMGTGATTKIAPKTVTFTEEMLNSLITEYPRRDDSLAQIVSPYLEDPHLILIDGQIILAGETKEFGTLSSAHFEPSVDEQGNLLFRLAGISAGRLPVPQSMLSDKIDKMKGALHKTESTYSSSADFDPNGLANGSAAAVAMSRLFLNALDDHASDPVLFLPYNMGDWRKSVAVKVDSVKVSEGSITLTLSSMTKDEEAELLKKIRGGELQK